MWEQKPGTKKWFLFLMTKNGLLRGLYYVYWCTKLVCFQSTSSWLPNPMTDYSWIGLPVDAHKTLISQKTEKSCIRQIRDHVQKPPSEENQDLFGPVLCDPFWAFSRQLLNNVRTSLDQAELDSPRQILFCQGLRPFWGASDQWKIYCIVS